MKALELKIPPPLVALCAGLLMWSASKATASLDVPLALRAGLCIVLVLAGFGIGFAGLLAFRRARTTVNPTRPQATTRLVTAGVYAMTRNPMYLGLLLILCGYAAYLANPLALLVLPLFVAYLTLFQIGPEERVLASLFATDFPAYAARVRRWL